MRAQTPNTASSSRLMRSAKQQQVDVEEEVGRERDDHPGSANRHQRRDSPVARARPTRPDPPHVADRNPSWISRDERHKPTRERAR